MRMTDRVIQMGEMAIEADQETLRLPLVGIAAAVALGGALWAVIGWSVWSILA